jgi:hypothetical protein
MATITENRLQRFAESRGPDLRVVTGGNCAPPWELLELIDGALPAYRLFMLNAPHGIPDHPGVTLETPFVGPGMRRKPNLRYLPARLSQVPTLLRTTAPPDIVCVRTSAPHAGRVSLGVEVNILPAAVEAARARGAKVIAQVNDRMPWTLGDAEIDVDQIDLMIEADGAMPTAPAPRIDEVSGKIGALVAARVRDGATLQAGIGAVPDATL